MRGESHAEQNQKINGERIFRFVPRGHKIMDDLTRIAVNDMAHELCDEYCGRTGCPSFKHVAYTGEQVDMLWHILENVNVYEMTVGEYMTYAMIVAKLENSDLDD